MPKSTAMTDPTTSPGRFNEEKATYTVRGEAQVQAPEKGRGKAMTQVTALVNTAG